MVMVTLMMVVMVMVMMVDVEVVMAATTTTTIPFCASLPSSPPSLIDFRGRGPSWLDPCALEGPHRVTWDQVWDPTVFLNRRRQSTSCPVVQDLILGVGAANPFHTPGCKSV